MKLQNKNRWTIEIMFMIVIILMSTLVLSESIPEGPTTIDVIESSTKGVNPGSTQEAYAGNVSQLEIYAITQTRTWQGYYGNITGEIVLGDSSGNIVYDWENANPSGQIFASTTEIDFSPGNVVCYNFSKTGGSYMDLDAYETNLSISQTAADGINETFNESTDYDPFYVGIDYINQTCPVTYLYNATNESTVNTYQEVMLYENTTNDVIYTSIIRPGGIIGFNNLEWDFQMIVAEDGHSDDIDTTTYYFYVSLE